MPLLRTICSTWPVIGLLHLTREGSDSIRVGHIYA